MTIDRISYRLVILCSGFKSVIQKKKSFRFVVFNDNEDESTRKLIAVCQMISQSSAALPQVQHYNFNNINNNQFANTFPIHQLYGYKTVPHIHNRNNYKKQVPKHISSRGMPPPPGSNTVTVNRTSKLSRQNTDYNIINPNNILQKKHMKKASSYRDTIPPPPPKTPPPHPKSKSARNRHIYRKYNTHQQQPIQLQTPSYSQTPISKSLGNNNNNNSILGASLQHKPHHKHSYTSIQSISSETPTTVATQNISNRKKEGIIII
eukprot:140731_1